jgi:hypothetical protein
MKSLEYSHILECRMPFSKCIAITINMYVYIYIYIYIDAKKTSAFIGAAGHVHRCTRCRSLL